MICPECKTKNIKKASYCMSCKHEFSEEEQEAAYKKTIFYYLEAIEEWYYKLNLEVVTDHIAFKIFLLLIVLGTGIYYLKTRGIHTNILKNESYEVYYYEKDKVYYILIPDNLEKVNLSLYIPNRVKSLELSHYTMSDKLIDSKKINKKKGLSLSPYENDYYVLTSSYSNRKKEKLKLMIYHESDVEK